MGEKSLNLQNRDKKIMASSFRIGPWFPWMPLPQSENRSARRTTSVSITEHAECRHCFVVTTILFLYIYVFKNDIYHGLEDEKHRDFING